MQSSACNCPLLNLTLKPLDEILHENLQVNLECNLQLPRAFGGSVCDSWDSGTQARGLEQTRESLLPFPPGVNSTTRLVKNPSRTRLAHHLTLLVRLLTHPVGI